MAIRSFEKAIPQLGNAVFVDTSAVVIGDVRLGDDSSVWPAAVIRGDIHSIRIGARSSIQDGSVIHVTHAGPFNPEGFPTSIGNEVTVGHKVMLHGCTVGDRVLIGMGSIVMDGAVIESEVVVGGGSLVPPGRVLEGGYLYVGAPVKQIRRLTAGEIEFFSYAANKYVELKNRYLTEYAE
jgi:carbonic anhydrase/acetyltransferase-like protein (isoleucine patch superfamily)